MPGTFRSSGAFKVGMVPQFYKHFVPLGLKTTTDDTKRLLFYRTTHCPQFQARL